MYAFKGISFIDERNRFDVIVSLMCEQYGPIIIYEEFDIQRKSPLHT